MAGDLQARRRKIRERVKDSASGDASDDEYEEPSPDGNSCLSALVIVALLGGVGLLFGMISLQSGALEGSAPLPPGPSARQAQVVLEHGDDSTSQPPPVPADGGPAPPESSASAVSSSESGTG
ncbi:uncharacterized protein LOC119095206 [Pollicipes pollicipes]|uniref:uncharacterized protein LOC119095206 n=1 Tax=Pollicipes pollicipes TaxID=41117 RepID=UPI00188553B1|nr:uncharacterized protein LOC119095206 [Pollicipes pollicipes]